MTVGNDHLNEKRGNSCVDAFPLWNRFGYADASNPTSRSREAREYRCEVWRARLKDSSGGLIERRCALGGYDYATVQEELERTPSPDANGDLHIPPSLTLEDAPLKEQSFRADALPFWQILYPIAARAVRSLTGSLSADLQACITESAWNDLQTALLSELCRTSHHALSEEFELFKRLGVMAQKAMLSRLTKSKSAEVYEAFRSSVSERGGFTFYRTYPVLLRLLGNVVECWTENTRRLLEAFARDQREISKLLNNPGCGAISSIELGKSDPHHGRQSVAIISVEGGGRIVFKPRPIGSEIAFMKVLSFMNRHSGQSLYRTMKAIPRSSYGWCEFVEHAPPKTIEEAREYYRRTGLLLAVLYALRTTDCHFENLLAVDGYPMMIDLETLMHPNYELMEIEPSMHPHGTALYESVARVGILPSVPLTPDDFDSSALGFDPDGRTSRSVGYDNADKSGMKFGTTQPAYTTGPWRRSGEPLDREALTRCIQEGFQEGYVLVLEVRDALLTDLELLCAVKETECRFVPRNTRTYAWLYERSLDAAALRSGIDRSLEFEALFRGAAISSSPDKWYALAEAERQALEELDIPRFTVACDGKDLLVGEHVVIKDALRESAWNLAVKHLRSLSLEDLRSQLNVISLSFAQSQRGWPIEPSRRVSLSLREISSTEVVNTAEKIGEKIWQARMHRTDAPVSWLTLEPIIGTGEHRLTPAGFSLYQGTVGIALYFAALHVVTGSLASKERCYDALQEVLSACDRNRLTKTTRFDLGDGLLGIAYGLYRIGSLLNDGKLRAKAADLLIAISDETLRDSEKLDVLGGVAGFLLVGEVMSRDLTLSDIHRKMQLSMERIVTLQQDDKEHGAGWITSDGQALPGFAHGSSGITYALARATRVIGDGGYTNTIRRGIQHQYYLYREHVQNWEELRATHQGKPLPASWCHGAVGIALAMAGLEDIDPRRCSDTLEYGRIAIANSFENEPASDCVCCGVAGVLEFAHVAQGHPHVRSLKERALKYLCEVDSYRCLTNRDSQAVMVGLFNGITGIGYQLLRSQFPEKIPSILLFD